MQYTAGKFCLSYSGHHSNVIWVVFKEKLMEVYSQLLLFFFSATFCITVGYEDLCHILTNQIQN